MPTTSSFIWGRGGKRLSPDDIALQRRLAAQQIATGSDFSPLQHWTQGLARVANGVAGGLNMRRADDAAAERASGQEAVLQALLSGGQVEGGDPVAAALLDPELRQFGMKAWEARQPEPVEPVIQRANNGDIIGLNPQTGEVMFQRADPNPRPVIDWISVKNDDGTTTLMPVGPNGPIASGATASPPAVLPPDFDFGEPTTQNTAPPELGANGMPSTLTRAQYQAVVNAKGQAATDAWVQRNNIRIGG